MRVHRAPEAEPEITVTDAAQWALLERCLRDPSLAADVRAAGALLLLYGVSVTRIAQLRRDDLSSEGGRVFVRLGAHRTLLPPAVARLLEALPYRPSNRSLLEASIGSPSAWLFPGHHAN